MTGPCKDRHGVALRLGDRISVDATITAIDETHCYLQLRIRANERRAVAVTIDFFNAYSDQVVKLPEPIGRTDRWA
jgi:acyl-CoA thioesterase FadM